MIIIPTTTSRSLTTIERINIAALEYSNESTRQEDFRAGARWMNKGDEWPYSTGGTVLAVIVALFVLLNIMGAVAGLMEVNDRFGGRCENKWRYIVPAYNICYVFSKWMSE